jgi:WD40 repeat protein
MIVTLAVGILPDVALASTPGAQLWVHRYNGPGDGDDYGSLIAASPDGTVVFLAGQSTGVTSGFDYVTVAYDALTGAGLWSKRYNGPGNSADQASALAVSRDGSKVFVTGYSVGSAISGTDYATVAYDASNGDRLWVKRYNGPGNSTDLANALAVSPDGSKVVVTGGSAGSNGLQDYATIAYDVFTGAKLWVKRYNGPGNDYDVANAIVVSSDGGVFVTGQSSGSTSAADYATAAYDLSTGTQLWVKRYNGLGNGEDIARAVGVSPDGTVAFVTGYSTGPASTGDYVTVAYDAATGAKLWLKRYNGTGDDDDAATALEVSADGSRLFVTGTTVVSGGGDPYDYGTVAYNAATGAQRWVKLYNGPGNAYDAATDLEVSADGSKVFVTGYSAGSTTGTDYATVTYDAATGAKLWLKRYNGPGNGDDYAVGLDVSPGGSEVFVTGYGAGSASGYDIATIAYAA